MYFRLSLFFIFSNLFGLLARSIAWDSRLWFTHIKNHDIDRLYWFLNQAKLVGQLQFFSFLAFVKDPLFVANLSSFVSWWGVTLFFYWFVTELKLGTPTARLVAACWVAMKPSCLVSYELCHAPYNVGILLYCLGLWSLISYESKMKNWGLVLYFLGLFLVWHMSFTLLRSLMFLHYGLIVILYLNKNISYKTLSVLMLMPVISWMFKGTPTGYYENYNQVNLAGLNLRSFAISFKETNWLIFGRMRRWIGRDPVLIVTAIVLLPVFFYGLFASRKSLQEEVKRKIMNMPIWLWLGCCLFFVLFLIFPYAATGRILEHNDLESRHAILFFFPQALLILGLYQLFSLSRFKRATQWFFCVWIVLFFVGTVENQRRWQIDGFVQDAMIENLKELSFDRSVSVLVFDQKAVSLFHMDRRPNIYEYNGLLDAALGEQKWVGIDKAVESNLAGTPQDLLEMYLCKNCRPSARRQTVKVESTDVNPYSWSNYFNLITTSYLDKNQYRLLAKNLLNLEVLK